MRELEDILPPAALIVGCGDIGLRVARRLRAMQRQVTGIVKSRQSAARVVEAGATAIVIDMDTPVDAAIAAPPRSTDRPPTRALIFYFAPPPIAGTTDPRLRCWLATVGAPPPRIVYISTSGVYGDCDGRWIDEDEPLKPLTDRARRRLDAEGALHDHARLHGSDVIVLRVPGIYGPGRLPVERLRRALPVIREEESPYSNRIHADDLAEAALHAAAFGAPGRAYNVSDGAPTTMCDYFTRCARVLGLPPPPQVSLDEARVTFTPAMWSFAEESRRLLTTRLRGDLRFTPRYADLDAGLAASR